MKQGLYILTIFSVLIISCQTDNTGNNNSENHVKEQVRTLEKHEIELISQTIFELILPTPPPPPPPINENEETEKDYTDRIDKERKEYQRYLDTTLFTFYLVDSLIVPNQRYLESYSDTAYSGLAKILQSDTLTARPIDLKRINTINHYKLLKSKPDKNWQDWGSGFIVVAQYSRIIFSKDYSRAFFYFDFVCGSLCGSGYLILAEKKNGQWKIVRKDMIWFA